MHQVEVSDRDMEAIKFIKDIDMDLLKELLKTKKDSTAASKSQGRRTQSRGRRSARTHGVRQLNAGRRLDVAPVLDTMWLLICGTFVFFMHAGFAMLEAGTGRAKNV